MYLDWAEVLAYGLIATMISIIMYGIKLAFTDLTRFTAFIMVTTFVGLTITAFWQIDFSGFAIHRIVDLTENDLFNAAFYGVLAGCIVVVAIRAFQRT